MLLRTLSLLLPVALTIANTLVGQSDIDALKDAFNSAAQTILEIRGACGEFADNVDIAHATVVTNALSILDSQLRNFTTLIPDHVMTDTDGRWACDAYAGDVTPATEFVEAINSRKNDFQAVHFTSHVCHSLQKLATDGASFHEKFMAAIPAAYKACIEQYYDAAEKEKEKLVEAFCEKE
ncbi:uncharacterized protein ARMOST_19529 [Armillaria ostoyae]|uniref:Uncharacterized protein n=1 Tax=Armillaria ostoyae TaxID=47428 RepID=A0A284S4T0_ARMOS|nr:uncharacterized protein ARMOST_19529 [Armillaria ostoyae]